MLRHAEKQRNGLSTLRTFDRTFHGNQLQRNSLKLSFISFFVLWALFFLIFRDSQIGNIFIFVSILNLIALVMIWPSVLIMIFPFLHLSFISSLTLFDLGASGQGWRLTPMALTLYLSALSVPFIAFHRSEKIYPASLVSSALRIIVIVWIAAIPQIIGGVLYEGIVYIPKGILRYAIMFGQYSFLPLVALYYLKKEDIPKVLFSLLALSFILLVEVFVNFSGKRAESFVGQPNTLGTLAMIFINLAIATILYYKKKDNLLPISYCALTASLILLTVSGSREALLGLIASLIWWVPKMRFSKMLISLVVLFSVVVTIYWFSDTRFKQLIMPMQVRLKILQKDKFKETNVVGRINAQIDGIIISYHNPLGIGFGNFHDLSGHSTTDSQYVNVLVEGGFIGLFLFVFILIKLFRMIKRFRFEETDMIGSLIRSATISTFIGLLVVGLAANVFFNVYVMIVFWILISLCFKKAEGISSKGKILAD